jgi:hypothetical protein
MYGLVSDEKRGIKVYKCNDRTCTGTIKILKGKCEFCDYLPFENILEHLNNVHGFDLVKWRKTGEANITIS